MTAPNDMTPVVRAQDRRGDEASGQPIELDRWAGLAERVLARELNGGEPDDDHGPGAAATSSAELSLVFVDDDEIRRLNREHRGVDRATDVLSFSIDPEPPTAAADSSPPWMLGDVVVCPAVAARNAPGHAGTYEDELALLVVHGVLHLCGMDHLDDADAEEMEARERHHLVSRPVVPTCSSTAPDAPGCVLPPHRPTEEGAFVGDPCQMTPDGSPNSLPVQPDRTLAGEP